MKTIIRIIALIGLSSLMFGCKSIVVEISSADNGSRIELEQGSTLELKLDGNPSTGYSWEILQDGSPILSFSGEEWSYEEVMPGSPGEVTFSFLAVQAGEIQLHLVYHRTWEEDVPPLEEYIIDVIVR